MKKTILLLLILTFLLSCKKELKNTKIAGPIFGTTYSAIYDSETDYQKQFDSLFYVINKSMSTYIENSDISKLNRNEIGEVDSHFSKVFNTSKKINLLTSGAFDPTIGVVVNAWGFGPDERVKNIDSLKVDSLMQYVGLKKVSLFTERRTYKIRKLKGTFIDFNAIAKGYAVDVISDFLESKNINDYLVEIGGELRAKGINKEKNTAWKVGIDQPRFDGGQSVLTAISIKDQAMASSGTYRKFKLDENGNRYAHIIDAKTGYPSKTNLLGISVIARDCMTADAYATAFKAMGVSKVKDFAKNHLELKILLIFENEKNELETLSLNGFPEK